MTSHHPTHPLRLIMRAATAMLLTAATFIPATAQTDEPALVRSEIGDKASTRDGAITITNIGKKQQFNASQRSTYDTDIHSPKSAAFHPDGSRFYVNSLEGCRTIVYDARSMRKLKVINHTFKPDKATTGPLRLTISGNTISTAPADLSAGNPWR